MNGLNKMMEVVRPLDLGTSDTIADFMFISDILLHFSSSFDICCH